MFYVFGLLNVFVFLFFFLILENIESTILENNYQTGQKFPFFLIQMLHLEVESMKQPMSQQVDGGGFLFPYLIFDHHLRTKHVYLSTKAEKNKA